MVVFVVGLKYEEMSKEAIVANEGLRGRSELGAVRADFVARWLKSVAVRADFVARWLKSVAEGRESRADWVKSVSERADSIARWVDFVVGWEDVVARPADSVSGWGNFVARIISVELVILLLASANGVFGAK